MEIVTTKERLRKVCGDRKIFLYIDKISEAIAVGYDQVCKILDERFRCLQVADRSKGLVFFNIVTDYVTARRSLADLLNMKFDKSEDSIRMQKDIISILIARLQIEDLIDLQWLVQKKTRSLGKRS